MGEISSCSYSFSDFPEDVQLCILSFLNPTEIANFACTSRKFSPLCQNDSKLWYSICDRRWGSKTQIKKWGNGQISYKLLYKTLSKWDHLIGFWRRCGQTQQKQTNTAAAGVKPPSLVFFEWGPSYLSGSRASPCKNGSYGVIKRPFLLMGISPEGQIVNYLDPDGNSRINNQMLSGELEFLEMEMDLVTVNVNFIGDMHFSVEENLGFIYSTSPISKGECTSSSSSVVGEDVSSGSSSCHGVESGSPGSLPGTSDMYEYYANRMSPGAYKAWRKQRRREKEKLRKKKWETEHFLKIVHSLPSPSRPLQGLWKGICYDMNLEFYLVAYDGAGISCRRVGDFSERLSSSTPVFWTSKPAATETPFSPEEDYLYNSRIHIQPPVTSECPLLDNNVVSRIMCINSSYDLVIPGLAETSANPWHVEGRIWQYTNGTFGFGFLRDNFIVDLKHIAQNGCLLDIVEEICSD